MTNRETLRSLAEQVEALSGPSHEVECLIFEALGWTKVDNPTSAGGLFGRWYRPDGTMTGQDGTPRVTASIDSAISLVPEGLTDLSLNQSADASQALIFRDGDGVVGRGDATGGAAVDRAARAIVAASLRAIGEGL